MKRIQQEQPNQPRHIPINQQEEIRRRAYEIYEERGSGDGSEVEDWLQAETEVLHSNQIQKAA
jgi:hypothetical protein